MIQQLSIFDLPVQDTPTKLRYPNPKKAQKFRDLAERMQSQIDAEAKPCYWATTPYQKTSEDCCIYERRWGEIGTNSSMAL